MNTQLFFLFRNGEVSSSSSGDSRSTSTSDSSRSLHNGENLCHPSISCGLATHQMDGLNTYPSLSGMPFIGDDPVLAILEGPSGSQCYPPLRSEKELNSLNRCSIARMCPKGLCPVAAVPPETRTSDSIDLCPGENSTDYLVTHPKINHFDRTIPVSAGESSGSLGVLGKMTAIEAKFPFHK